MARYIMVVPSNALPGRDDDYNAWYEGVHIADVCAIPGVISGHRYEADPASPVTPDGRYLAIYEIEAEDPAAVLAELMRRVQSGEISLSDSVDVASARMMLFKARV